MSDRIPAEIWIGGKIAASLVPDLCAAITDEGVSLEWGGRRVDPYRIICRYFRSLDTSGTSIHSLRFPQRKPICFVYGRGSCLA